MEPPQATASVSDPDSDLTTTVLRERSKLGNFIRRRIRNPMDAEDLLQDVLQELVQAYRLPEPIEQASAWLFRVARNRIIDGFRKAKHRPMAANPAPADSAEEYRLNLALPEADCGPEALYTRSVILQRMQLALDELPPKQREVFIQHELEGSSFKDMSAKTGIAVNTLLARKRSAVLHLRTRLRTLYEELDV